MDTSSLAPVYGPRCHDSISAHCKYVMMMMMMMMKVLDDNRQLLDDQLARLLSSFQDGDGIEDNDDEYAVPPQYAMPYDDDDELYPRAVRYTY